MSPSGSLPVPLMRQRRAEKQRVEAAKFGRLRCASYISSSLDKNPIINFPSANRGLCNSIPHKLNTIFHLISSVPKMSLTFFTRQLITVIHPPVLQILFFFHSHKKKPPPTQQVQCRQLPRSSSQPLCWVHLPNNPPALSREAAALHH